jgi:hypothetical protein
LGRRLHQFDEIEHLFDNFASELVNEDYNHNPLVTTMEGMHRTISSPSDVKVW